ncbi:MAG: molybdate ABC transporter substrate-binding protein [Desulfosporosinus sp.]
MKKTSKVIGIMLLIFMTCLSLTACGNKSGVTQNEQTNKTGALSGKTLQVYCGAGMTKPFGEIAKAFKEETGCEMQVVYANAAQTQTQIKTTKEGDLFIAGSADELSPIKDYVAGSKNLVKHIPVLAVKSGNPLSITGLKDLAKNGVNVVLGDAEATPIGKISNKALSDLGILQSVNVVARTATAPEIFTALSMGQCNAIIVWKENASGSDVEIVKTTDLDAYVKTVPAASLNCSKDKATLDAFLAFLDTDKAKSIWKNYGYDVLN